MVGETEVRHYLRHCMHSSKVHSPYSAVRRRDIRSWILTRCLFPTALSIPFHFSSHSNKNLIFLTVGRHLRALQFSTPTPPPHRPHCTHLSKLPDFSGRVTGLFVKSPLDSWLMTALDRLVLDNQCIFMPTYSIHAIRDRIPVGTRFSVRPDRPWGPPSLLYNGYRVFPGGKVRPGRAADHSPPSSAAVMEE